jgi:hypothetical protein
LLLLHVLKTQEIAKKEKTTPYSGVFNHINIFPGKTRRSSILLKHLNVTLVFQDGPLSGLVPRNRDRYKVVASDETCRPFKKPSIPLKGLTAGSFGRKPLVGVR